MLIANWYQDSSFLLSDLAISPRTMPFVVAGVGIHAVHAQVEVARKARG